MHIGEAREGYACSSYGVRDCFEMTPTPERGSRLMMIAVHFFFCDPRRRRGLLYNYSSSLRDGAGYRLFGTVGRFGALQAVVTSPSSRPEHDRHDAVTSSHRCCAQQMLRPSSCLPFAGHLSQVWYWASVDVLLANCCLCFSDPGCAHKAYPDVSTSNVSSRFIFWVCLWMSLSLKNSGMSRAWQPVDAKR